MVEELIWLFSLASGRHASCRFALERVPANNLPDGQTFNSMWVLAVAFIGEPGEPAKRRSEPAKRRSKGFGSAFRAMRDKLHWGRSNSSKRLGQGRKIVHDTVRDDDELSAKIPGA
jgi:hypothetical protein